MKQLNEINEKLITLQKENIKLLEEIIKNKDLIIQELKQQLLIQDVVGRSEQLPTDIEVGKMISDLASLADDEIER